MTHTSTEQPEALRLATGQSGGKSEWADTLHAAVAELRSQRARIAELEDAADMAIKRIAELEEQLSAIGAGGVEPLRKAAATPIAWYVTGCSTMLDEHDAKAEAKRCGGSAKAVPLYTVPRGHAATQPAAQEMDTYKDRDTIFFLAGWNGCNEGLNAHEQFKKATIAAQAKQGERP